MRKFYAFPLRLAIALVVLALFKSLLAVFR